MYLILAREVALAVEVTEEEIPVMGEGNLGMVEERLGTVEETLGIAEEIPVMDVEILAIPLIDQVLDVKTDRLPSELTTTALARHIPARNASIQYRSTLLEVRRSSRAVN